MSVHSLRDVTRPPLSPSRYGNAALRAELDTLELAPLGHRHRTLYATAEHLGELVAGGELDAGTIEPVLIQAGELIGLPRSDAIRTVRRGLERGSTNPRRAPEGNRQVLQSRTDAIGAVCDWWATIERDPALRTRTGATTRRILAAFFRLAMKAGKVELAESYREIAEASGVSIGTITKHRAAWNRYVRQIEPGNRWKATRSQWRLLITKGRASGNMPEASPTGEAGVFPTARGIKAPSDNYWHRWSTGWATYRRLEPDAGRTVAELAEETGLHRGTIRRTLHRFAADGIAQRDCDGLWTECPDAESPPGLDRKEERRERHRLDRLVHADRRHRLAADRERRTELERAHRNQERGRHHAYESVRCTD